jgi:hypothetical protein
MGEFAIAEKAGHALAECGSPFLVSIYPYRPLAVPMITASGARVARETTIPAGKGPIDLAGKSAARTPLSRGEPWPEIGMG